MQILLKTTIAAVIISLVSENSFQWMQFTDILLLLTSGETPLAVKCFAGFERYFATIVKCSVQLKP